MAIYMVSTMDTLVEITCGYALSLLKTIEPAAPSRDTAADRTKA
jgi:hypothetical protein